MGKASCMYLQIAAVFDKIPFTVNYIRTQDKKRLGKNSNISTIDSNAKFQNVELNL